MNRHLAPFQASLQQSSELAKRQANPLHRKILENYVRHAALEISFPDRWMDIFNDEMMVEQPFYDVLLPGDVKYTRYSGDAEIQALYRSMLSVGMHTTEAIRIAVADWGFAIHEIGSKYATAEEARNLGLQIDDPKPDFTYKMTVRLANFWRFDEHCRLEGEDIHQLPGVEIEAIPPGEMFSYEDLLDVVRPFMGPPVTNRREPASIAA